MVVCSSRKFRLACDSVNRGINGKVVVEAERGGVGRGAVTDSSCAVDSVARLADFLPFLALCGFGRASASLATRIRFTIVLALSSGRPLVALISFGVHMSAISRSSFPRRWLGYCFMIVS